MAYRPNVTSNQNIDNDIFTIRLKSSASAIFAILQPYHHAHMSFLDCTGPNPVSKFIWKPDKMKKKIAHII